ncbi:MAG TPA: DUF488 domain-containing protein [Pelobium sp.]|nr:DUF488 domain-containing protein [Pelobium sp.]
MNQQQKTIWTVGHSTHSAEEFLSILKHYYIDLLVDVRRFPGSRKFPQFNREVLQNFLIDNGIKYIHLQNLGGRRKPDPDSKNINWRHPAFRAYADFMESEEFKIGIKELELLATEKVTSIMCSEVLWWRCHRSMIADQLKANGWEVVHILSKEKSTEHPYTQPAKVVDGELTYH